MDAYVHLIAHNIISIISSIVLVGVALLSFFNGKKNIANITLALTLLSAAVFSTSHVIGVNIVDPYISKNVLMFNLCLFMIAAFCLHAVFCLIKKNVEKRWMIVFIYASAFFCIGFFIMNPDFFLLPSEPKMYFPNYYVAGSLNWTRVMFFYFICGTYMVYLLFREQRLVKDPVLKKQYGFFGMTIILGCGIGMIPNFLVYDIQIDPLWGMLFAPLFAIPLVYGAVRYGLFNVKVIAKQAFALAVGMVIVGSIITLLNYSNTIIHSAYPHYPLWVNTLISSGLAVVVSLIVWKHLREIDLLKYEFITTVTHKFRTPLTGIKWATENLNSLNPTEEQKTQIDYIKNANEKLVELTDLLVTTSEAEHASYEYHFEQGDITQATESVLESLLHQIQTKSLVIEKKFVTGIMAQFDQVRMKFVLQTLIENAIHYSVGKGTVTIEITQEGKNIRFTVRDQGIGMDKEELLHIFSKFYRTSRARAADTEGLGIGLFIAKEIVLHHKGKIWAESEGQGKGSVFTFTIPRG